MAEQPELNKWTRYNVACGCLIFRGSGYLRSLCVVCLSLENHCNSLCRFDFLVRSRSGNRAKCVRKAKQRGTNCQLKREMQNLLMKSCLCNREFFPDSVAAAVLKTQNTHTHCFLCEPPQPRRFDAHQPAVTCVRMCRSHISPCRLSRKAAIFISNSELDWHIPAPVPRLFCLSDHLTCT